jgi:hypothetical protein
MFKTNLIPTRMFVWGFAPNPLHKNQRMASGRYVEIISWQPYFTLINNRQQQQHLAERKSRNGKKGTKTSLICSRSTNEIFSDP